MKILNFLAKTAVNITAGIEKAVNTAIKKGGEEVSALKKEITSDIANLEKALQSKKDALTKILDQENKINQASAVLGIQTDQKQAVQAANH